MHHIRTKLFSRPLSKLNPLYKTSLKTTFLDSYSNKYKLVSIILRTNSTSLFKFVTLQGNKKETNSFLSLSVPDKCLDAINLGNILHHISLLQLKFHHILKINQFQLFFIALLHIMHSKYFQGRYFCLACISFNYICCWFSVIKC